MKSQWFNPDLIAFGPVHIRWYGLMYVIGFLLGGKVLNYLAKEKFWPIAKEEIDKYITALIIGMFLGARLAYVFIYNWDYYSTHLGEIFAVWQGGLSFHGAVFGMCMSTLWFARKHKVHFFQIADCLAVAGTLGLFFGRMGNFINGELYGRVTDSFVGIVFPDGGPYPRHPSQLYEGVLEGLVLFAIMFWLHRKQKYYGIVSTFFLIGYGAFRFIVEFFREPDVQVGYLMTYFTMGQLLCVVMIICSYGIYWLAKRANIANPLRN